MQIPHYNDHTKCSLPLVSFVIFAYNQESYIQEAVRGALSQTYEPMEIILSDDCSTDGTFENMLRIANDYHGPHKVITRRNHVNLGFTAHISAVMEIVSGDLIISADGDDISYPSRTQRVVEAWLHNKKQSGSIMSLYDSICPGGRILRQESKDLSLKYTIKDRNLDIANSCCVGTLGCTLSWTRDVFDIFGPLDSQSIHQDITIPLRSLLFGSLIFIQDSLVLYRRIDSSLSRITFSSSSDRANKLLRYYTARIANYKQFDRDMCLALDKELVDPEDALWLLSRVKWHREYARITSSLLTSDRIKQVLISISYSNSFPLRSRIKALLSAIFPSIYKLRSWLN